MRHSCGRDQQQLSSSSATGCGTTWTRASRWLPILWLPAHIADALHNDPAIQQVVIEVHATVELQVQTEKMGDIHHYAWRARHRNQTAYIAPRDGERFGTWTKDQCATEDCVEVHRLALPWTACR